MFKKPYRWAICYTLLLIISSSYVLLDAFVIPKAQVVVTNTTYSDISETTTTQAQSQLTEISQTTTSSTASTPIITDTSYDDGTLSIQLSTQYDYDSTIYVVDIVTSDPSLLKTAFAQDTFGRNIKATTSEIAQANNAILAINGDYYGFRDDGAVLRNGILYRDTVRQGDITEALVISTDGEFSIIDETTTDVSSLDTSQIAQILSFGPALVIDGVSVISDTDEVDTKSDSLLNPRTAIGMIEPGHYVIVVVDGRTSQSAGVTLSNLADIFVSLGATVAYNLDGGGSSALVFNGTLINQPTTNGNSTKEREVSDIVYFGY